MAAGGEQLQQLLVLHRLRRGCLIGRPRGRPGGGEDARVREGEGERGRDAGGPGSPPHAPAPGALAEAPAEAPAVASAPCQKAEKLNQLYGSLWQDSSRTA